MNSNPTLEFVAAPALAPAVVEVDAALMEQYQKELAQVRFTCSQKVSVHSFHFLSRLRLFLCPKKTTTCNLIDRASLLVLIAILLSVHLRNQYCLQYTSHRTLILHFPLLDDFTSVHVAACEIMSLTYVRSIHQYV